MIRSARRSNSLFVLLSIFVLQAFSVSAFALQKVPYYGEEFYVRLASGERDKDLIKNLRDILSSMHVRRPNMPDAIVHKCDAASRGCYWHNPIGYKAARKVVLGQLQLEEGAGGLVIKEVYCQKDYGNEDFPGGKGPQPGHTVDDHIVNVEHTWPQSRFNPSMNNNAQKSDLHHLFATDSEMNRIRGNLKFGEVDVPAYALPCTVSKMGSIRGHGGDYFEPPTPHKGNVARALFYFSVRYSLKIDEQEEAFLRKWHEEDPVDAAEAARNDAVQKIQGNRNPFIDNPELVSRISDF